MSERKLQFSRLSQSAHIFHVKISARSVTRLRIGTMERKLIYNIFIILDFLNRTNGSEFVVVSKILQNLI